MSDLVERMRYRAKYMCAPIDAVLIYEAAGEIERLTAEIAEVKGFASHLGILRAQEEHNRMIAERDERIATLDASLAESQQDAARYRWLRNRLEVRKMENVRGDSMDGLNVRFGCAYFHLPNREITTRSKDDARLDTCIDAALSGKE